MKVKTPKNFDFEGGTYKLIEYYKVGSHNRDWDSEGEKTVYILTGCYNVVTTMKYGGLFLQVYTGDDYPDSFDADTLFDLAELLTILETNYPSHD